MLDSNMIDVLHPGTSELSQHFAQTGSQRSTHTDNAPKQPRDPAEDPADDEEAAWLQAAQAAGTDNVTAVQGLQSDSLVMDIGQLRDEPTPSVAKKSLKGNLSG